MREITKAVALTLMWCAGAGAACAQDPAAAQKGGSKTDWRVEWRNATVSFGLIDHDSLNQKFFHALGTGVIVSTGEHTGYIVTARHIFCDSENRFHPNELRVRYAWQDRKSIFAYFGVSLIMRNEQGADLWSSLDDDSDIAAIPLPFPFDAALPPEDHLDHYPTARLEDIATDPFDGEPVWVLGYPGLVGNEQLVRAILRQGVVAWTNPNEPSEKPFLIDANLYPGNSGGPVIQIPIGLQSTGVFDYLTGDKRAKLLGIVSKAPIQDIKTTVSNSRIGQVETHTPIVGIGAIGVIEPGSKVRRLINAMEGHIKTTPVCDVPSAGK